ncbi:hypothetical protein [Kitasatospora purpeofusca]|uniref:hypothetical protein n=1 Tax=Kitasatospora purpeofusca TaxID=67352 RepID=UPI002A599668|nr:hypothetical protein [Kitasatospora purpeofusca]MDY0810686.1 hypothetical protein [Kitasatospora purpeofusca]
MTWNGADRIVAALVGGEDYLFVAGAFGRPAAPSARSCAPPMPPRSSAASRHSAESARTDGDEPTLR